MNHATSFLMGRRAPGCSSTSRLGAIGVAGTLLLTLALCAPVRLAVVSGDSMAPRLRSGQLLVCERSRGSQPIVRGEMVLAQVAGGVCVKRVFAVAGDRFWQAEYGHEDDAQPQLIQPNVSIAPWRERYPNLRLTEVSVPPNSIFLVGEGVTSQDSRRWGSVPQDCVLGRVILPRAAPDDGWIEAVAWKQPPQRRTVRSARVRTPGI